MKLTLKNKDLLVLQSILDKLNIPNIRINRGRAKLYAKVEEKLTDYAQDEREVLDEFVAVDENGIYQQDETGQLLLKKDSSLVELNQLLTELGGEEVVIDSGEYTARYLAFFDWLADSDQNLTTEEIVLLDNLLDQYEIQKGDN